MLPAATPVAELSLDVAAIHAGNGDGNLDRIAGVVKRKQIKMRYLL
jgi:hypothetical protein